MQRVATVDGWDEDLALTYAGLNVALAVSELEWAGDVAAQIGRA